MTIRLRLPCSSPQLKNRPLFRLAIVLTLSLYGFLLLIFFLKSIPLRLSDDHQSPDEEGEAGNGDNPPAAVKDSAHMKQLLNELKMLDYKLETDSQGIDDGGDDFVDPLNIKMTHLMRYIFSRIDINNDGNMDIKELTLWIHGKTMQHIEKSIQDNIRLFTTIDVHPANGEVSWSEYHAYFLSSHGLSNAYITSHDRRHSALARPLKEAIMRDRARWVEAARNDPEKLSIDEHLAFTHPESSHWALIKKADDLLEKFDRDGDEQLTEDEFADFPTDSAGSFQGLSRAGQSERRQEFRHLIDLDRNGKATKNELFGYIDPRNPRYAIQEAKHLIELSDTNGDKRVSLSEMLAKMDSFLESKVINTDKNFHEEFR